MTSTKTDLRLCSVCDELAVVEYRLPDPRFVVLEAELGLRCFEHRAGPGEAQHAYRIELGENVDTRPSPWSPINPPAEDLAVKVGAGSIQAEARVETVEELLEVLPGLVDSLRWTHPEHLGQKVGPGGAFLSLAVAGSATLIPSDSARSLEDLLEIAEAEASRREWVRS